MQTGMDDEEFELGSVPRRRSISDYGLKTDELSAKQKYEDTLYFNDPGRVARRRGLEDSMMQVREGILGRMKQRI